MIPFILCQAHGGKLITIDDRAVVTDLAAANGSGGTAYSPTLRTAPVRGGGLVRGKLRAIRQRVPHDGACTVAIAVVTNGSAGAPLSRAIALTGSPVVEIPAANSGEEFQLDITLSAFDADCGLSDAELFIIPQHGVRS